jgi:hypothetical protein
MKPTMTGKRIPARLPFLGGVAVALVLVSCATTAIVTRLAVAEGASTSSSSTTNLVVSTDKPNYTGSAAITVTGRAPSGTNAVTITIYNPARVAIVAVPVAVKQDDSFSTVFHAGGGSWNVSGKYTVIAIVQQQDTVAPAPTTNSTFFYTAGPTTTSSSVMTTTGGDGTSSIGSILGVVGVIVVAVALVGFMLRSRGRGTKAGTGATQTPVAQGF